jgi:hypothetical protein
MAQMAIDKIPPGPKLDALTAEKVFGWRSVQQHDDRDGFYGKRQDKADYWRLAKVPQYSTNFLNAYFNRGTNGTAWAVGSILERTLQDYPRQQYSVRLGSPGATMPGGD